ncbi:uncharacterized protein TNIN_349161 [Trichonephila inaurata madagascariensis]|uniref:Tetratricopeptide repeat protein n=1 Tax=Trichonephila inaurata madagascariensis TaxID=2747483 RepID=A0A8X6YQR2_9ARAC|nr:uncharacterized protein TNIN_349161 [Trichonephila inaurata madagascariensis]
MDIRLIKKKLEDFRDTRLIRVVQKHLDFLEKHKEDVKRYDKGAFSDEQQYQKFVIAEFFLKTLVSLEMKPDPTLTGFRQFVDDEIPCLQAFHLNDRMKEARKMKFCKKIDKGDVLHLQVVEEFETEYKLLVLNKYGESERLADYSIHAYLMKTYHLKRLGRQLKVLDYFRATVLGKLQMKENVFSKLLVSVNAKFVKEKYEGIELGIILKEDIPFYPEDISKYKSMLQHLKNKPFENCNIIHSRMASLGLNPYKTYSFLKSIDGKKYDGPRDTDSWIKNFQRRKKTLELLNEVELACKRSDFESGLILLNQEIKCYPTNDTALALKGRIYKDLWLMEKNPELFRKAMECYKKALELKHSNIIAKNDLHEIYNKSVKESLTENEDSPVIQQAMIQIGKDKKYYLEWKNLLDEETVSL